MTLAGKGQEKGRKRAGKGQEKGRKRAGKGQGGLLLAMMLLPSSEQDSHSLGETDTPTQHIFQSSFFSDVGSKSTNHLTFFFLVIFIFLFLSWMLWREKKTES